MKIIQTSLENEFEADVLTGIFKEEGIPFTVVPHHSEAYDGLFQLTMGWGHIEIPEEYQKKAEQLIQDYKKSLPEDTES